MPCESMIIHKLLLQAQHEKELRVLKAELLDMKKQRVKMLNKMRSEASKYLAFA